MSVERINVVVVGVDASQGSTAAIRWAAAEADRRRAALRLVHAYSIVPNLADNAWVDGRNLLEGARDDVGRRYPNLEITLDLEHDLALDLLRDDSASTLMAVVGTSTHHDFAAVVFGTVTTRLAGHTDCPVVVVREDGAAIDGSAPIVVGLDGSPGCADALAFAFEEASIWDRKLVAIHSWDESSFDGFSRTYPLAVDRFEIDLAEQRGLAEQMAGWSGKYPDVEVEQVVLRGQPDIELTRLGDQGLRPALIVIGTRGRSRVTSVLFGSTSRSLIADAPCPVAVVRRSAS